MRLVDTRNYELVRAQASVLTYCSWCLQSFPLGGCWLIKFQNNKAKKSTTDLEYYNSTVDSIREQLVMSQPLLPIAPTFAPKLIFTVLSHTRCGVDHDIRCTQQLAKPLQTLK